MSQFSSDNDAWAPESTEIRPSGSRSPRRPLLALAGVAGAVLVTVGAWVVLTGGEQELLDPALPVAADPFVATVPTTPAPSAPATSAAPTLNPAIGRDPFVPLLGTPVAPAAAGGGTSGTTAYPTVSPSTPAPAGTPAPTGKKKPIPTTGPTL